MILRGFGPVLLRNPIFCDFSAPLLDPRMLMKGFRDCYFLCSFAGLTMWGISVSRGFVM